MHERNDQGELTHFKNGDRFVYATHPISPPIERQVKIAGRQCRVFHNGQNNFCKICGLQGHRQGDSVCNAVTKNGLRPPGLEFRIMCLEDSVISIISPSSGGSPGLYVHKGGLKPD